MKIFMGSPFGDTSAPGQERILIAARCTLPMKKGTRFYSIKTAQELSLLDAIFLRQHCATYTFSGH
jgi:hypothetical protein